MTYNPNKPDSGPSPDLDAPNIMGDFTAYNNAFSVNHTPMNSVGQGKHANVIFQNQTALPGLVESSAFLFANNATSKANTQPQLFVQIPQFLPNEVANKPMQLTFETVNIVGPAQYQSFLIGGYLIYFGSISGTTAGNINTTITLSPSPTKILDVIATSYTMTTASPIRPFDVTVIVDTVTNLGFKITSAGNLGSSSIAYSFGWVAIAQA